MDTLLKKKLDREFELFSTRNFERPRKCKNPEQIRFYLQELSSMIDSFRDKSGYVPEAAYELLAQYNQEHNKWVYAEFKNSYC